MSDVTISIQIPEWLIQRAKQAGLTDDMLSRLGSENFIAQVEREIQRRESGKRLLEIADVLTLLPDELKPTPEEIEAARQEFWEEQARKK
jgi:transcriptional regulator with XRE-family HTH domain